MNFGRYLYMCKVDEIIIYCNWLYHFDQERFEMNMKVILDEH